MIRAPCQHGLQRCHGLLENRYFISTRLFSIKEDVLSPPDYKVEEITACEGESDEKPNLLPLFVVPLVWGTYSPIVKSVYSNSTVLAPPVLIFNILSYLVSFSSLLLAGVVGSTTNTNEESITADSEDENLERRVGIELGMYLFAGSTLQVFGITQVSAMKAAVLVQCTTIVVPLLESLLDKKKLSNRLWASCGAALFGVLLLTLDHPETLLSGAGGGAGVLDGLEKGDLFILGATLFYSMHVVRLSKFAARTKPLILARYKSGTELVAATVAVTIALSSSFLLETGDSTSFGAEIKEYFTQLQNLPSLATQAPAIFGILWNGAIATALTTYLQTVGQRNVSATTANVVYSSQPIWASLLSFAFLQERITSGNLIGATILATAVLLAATDPDTNTTATANAESS